MTLPHDKLLLTGAAGTLGRLLEPVLRAQAPRLVASDLAAAIAARGLVGATACDLADARAVHELMRGVQAVVHLGGVSVEGPFEPILQANIRGLHHLYEAARRHGTRRIVFASSNHVTGCYRVTDRIGPDHRPRPDGNYGLSKLFGEGLASLYFDRYGIETVCLRIGSVTPRPIDRRALATWLSPRDFAELVKCALVAPGVGCLVAYGCSANTRRWWDTEAAWARLGFRPQDDSEAYAAEVLDLWLPEGPQRELQGGSFVAVGPFDLPADAPDAPEGASAP